MKPAQKQFSLNRAASRGNFLSVVLRPVTRKRLKWLPAFLLMLLPAVGQAQFSYTTNNSAITITGYTGPGGAVVIPETITGLPVTTIGSWAFYDNGGVTSVTIPASVTSIGFSAFSLCDSLTDIMVDAANTAYSSVDGVVLNKNQTTLILCPGGKSGSYTIPNSVTTGVTSIGFRAFAPCPSLTGITVNTANTAYSSVDGVLFNKAQTALITFPGGRAGSYSIPTSVTTIGYGAFFYCTSLTSVTIPNSVSSIGDSAFFASSGLTAVYFQGNAPSAGSSVFSGANNATVYYLPGTTGWGTTFAGRPTVLWNPTVPTSDPSFGVKANKFGFTITGTDGLVIVVEAATDLANPVWSPLGTNTLTGGSSYFSDPQWTSHPSRYYRLRAP